jgi:hypothetical protein
MKMARASEEDIEAAFKVCRVLDELDKRYMPSDDDSDELEFFDRDDAEQCQKVVGMLLDATRYTSLFRVVFGMAVVLDPRNELLDPDADTIEHHPTIVKAIEDAERYRFLLRKVCMIQAASYGCKFEIINLPVHFGDCEADPIPHFNAAIDAGRLAEKPAGAKP